MIFAGMKLPNHNSVINNVNCKALGGQEHLLRYILAISQNHSQDKDHWERVDLGGVRVLRLHESACNCKWHKASVNLQIEETVQTERSSTWSDGNRSIMFDSCNKKHSRKRRFVKIFFCYLLNYEEEDCISNTETQTSFGLKTKTVVTSLCKQDPNPGKMRHSCSMCSQPTIDTNRLNSQNVTAFNRPALTCSTSATKIKSLVLLKSESDTWHYTCNCPWTLGKAQKPVLSD